MNRAEILDTAKGHVTVDRAADHGEMEDNFGTIAGFWSTYLGKTVSPHDVGAMMTLLKVARIKSNPAHPDHWTDGAGYMACGGEIATKPPRAIPPYVPGPRQAVAQRPDGTWPAVDGGVE